MITRALLLAGGWRAAGHAAETPPAGARPTAAELWARLVAGKPRARALGPLRRQLAKGQYPP